MSDEKDKAAAERLRAAVAKTKDDYIRTTAGDLVAAFRVAGVTGDPVAEHAAGVCETGKDGPDTAMMVHRDKHLSDVLAKLPAAA